MSGQDIHIAVAHEKGAGGLCTEVLHQGIDAGGVGLGGQIRAVAPDKLEPTGAEVVCDDLPAERICLVGKDGGLDAFGLQGVQQLRDAGIGSRLVFLVGIVPGRELGQRRGQPFGRPGIGGRKALHQLRDAVADHVLELLHRKGRPAVLSADPVACIGQVVDGVQKGAVQIKKDRFYHKIRLLSKNSKHFCASRHGMLRTVSRTKPGKATVRSVRSASTAQGDCRAVRQISGWKTQMLCR